MGLIPQSPTAAGPPCALGLISADDSASNCRGGTAVVRMLVRKCLFILKKKTTTHILSPGSLSSLEMPCLLSEGCVVLPQTDRVGDEQSRLSRHPAWRLTCSMASPSQWQMKGVPPLGSWFSCRMEVGGGVGSPHSAAKLEYALLSLKVMRGLTSVQVYRKKRLGGELR